ncbi:MAG: deoxyribodipyrimidine photo-lyase [Calditrichaeota bacterium]|nr:MAG: deoxyribodipyrimidine photo-lyase [Calditrichota bacterium]
MNEPAAVFWFRRDLRLEDNAGLFHALNSGFPVIPLFIFDKNILDDLSDKKDRRVIFIHRQLQKLSKEIEKTGSTLVIKTGKPEDVCKNLVSSMNISAVYTNRDYEPYARERDGKIENILKENGRQFHSFKDQVVFEKDDILKQDGNPYAVFTPYKNRWLDTLTEMHLPFYDSSKHLNRFLKMDSEKIPSLEEIGFQEVEFEFPSAEIDEDIIHNYHKTRDYPAMPGTTRLGIHLRFGTISIRKLVKTARKLNKTFLSELIWREFFMMILHHHPRVVREAYRTQYDDIKWIDNDEHFRLWCEGKTGYPMVDAGMRELNETGYMHNRVRMITASFLAKHLLIEWRRGEKYFADRLLDFELSSNNGNWQWAAGSGCDAAPYFRIFNPESQLDKYDPDHKYIKKWIPEFESPEYPDPMVNHKKARERALETYQKAVRN